ncbi:MULTISPECIES: hypothetical protein [Helicobacter]|uniref:Uncharacterized protein n=2 Tax=Helicobacter TaxID=209 RepID=A0ACC6FU01_9HELI|nr:MULTISPECIES: hypothetical protein [Helicobacter]MDL0080586.1 hypothetical protein [Helicobacter sp. CPD2-1]MDL0082773.1 hypothetical protein [Helicobacter sp. XJK30-2]STP06409.1 putative integral membrane protein [Helicobacter canis]
MRVSNFINLSVVSGFFIGLAIGIMKFEEPEHMLFMTIVVTISMYLISLTMAAIYIYIIEPKRSMLANKELIERQLEYFDSEFDQTERQARAIRQFISNFDFTEDKEVSKKKAQK